MEGEMISGAPRIVVNRGDQGGKVWKFLFVAQEAQEFDRTEFTVSVDIAVQEVRFEDAPPLLGDGGSDSQAGHAGQWPVGEAMNAHHVDAVADGAVFRNPVI